MLIEKLARQSGVSIDRLRWIEYNASKLYKTYSIPKKSGGERLISQPTPELKSIQRWIVRSVLSKFPISECAMAYHKGASIRKNASVHLGTSFTAHFDFENFFPSFTEEGVRLFFNTKTDLDDTDIRFCSKIVSRYGRLTIGAPSSPSLINVLMRDIDNKILYLCNKKNLIYTRYADDLNISSFDSFVLNDIEAEIERIILDFPYGNLKINHKKTCYLSRKYRRAITGLVVTPDGHISVGRDRKREIKSLIHQYSIGSLKKTEFSKLSGMLAYISDVEPVFLKALEKKYGYTIISILLHRI